MKLYLTLILLSYHSYTFGQEFEYDTLFPLDENKQINYERIIAFDSTSKDVIYNSILEFVEANYDKSLSQGSRINDKDAGLIAYPVIFRLSSSAKSIKSVSYKLTFKIKDNRYKLILSNVTFDGGETYLLNRTNGNIAVSVIKCGMDNCNYSFSPKKDWKSFREKMNEYFLNQLNSIENKLKAIKKDNSDW